MGAVDQLEVPEAVPVAPAEVPQTTEATATLSLAVPLKIIVWAVEETLVEDGEAMRSVGGVVSFAPGVGVGFVGAGFAGVPVEGLAGVVVVVVPVVAGAGGGALREA